MVHILRTSTLLARTVVSLCLLDIVDSVVPLDVIVTRVPNKPQLTLELDHNHVGDILKSQS